MGKLVATASLLLMIPAGYGISLQGIATGQAGVDRAAVSLTGVDQVDVDLELVLATDASSSMDTSERQLQAKGFTAAFRDDDVVGAIMGGPRGRIAVTYIEWSDRQRVIVPWRVIHDRSSALELASLLAQIPVDQTFGSTNLTGAIEYSTQAIQNNDIKGSRLVIDISGDGENNSRIPPDKARDQAVSAGITINGLPLNGAPDSSSEKLQVKLDTYFARHVIGGPGAFVTVVDRPREFGRAIRMKLLREIAGQPGPIGNPRRQTVAERR
jgi:Protein of unknown function (DUF1194)